MFCSRRSPTKDHRYSDRYSATLIAPGVSRCANSATAEVRRTVPLVGSTSPARILANCVLPTPFGPTSAERVEPSETFKLLKSSRPFGNSNDTPCATTIEDINNPAHARAPPLGGKKNRNWSCLLGHR